MPPSPSGYGPIFDSANELLAGVIAGYSNPKANPTLHDPTLPGPGPTVPPLKVPETQWVNEGVDFATMIRTESIVTGLTGTRTGFPGLPEARAIEAATGLMFHLSCWVFRLSTMPEDDSQVDPKDFTEGAKIIYGDLWVVMRSIILGVEPNATAPGNTPIFSPTIKASMPQVASLGPQGGLVGFEVSVEVEAS